MRLILCDTLAKLLSEMKALAESALITKAVGVEERRLGFELVSGVVLALQEGYKIEMRNGAWM